MGPRAAAHVGAVVGGAGAGAGAGELEPVEPELEPELDEPEPVLLDPVLPVLELEDGVAADELVPEVPLDPVFPVLEVVAALATNAPPARRPEVSAPMASTLRRRICMTVLPFISCEAPTQSGRHRIRCTCESGCSRTTE